MSAIRVEIAYALPGRPVLKTVLLAPGSTIGDAIGASGLLAEFPEIDMSRNRVGVFGRLARLDTPLRNGDRVEIYRPLVIDPKQARRLRAGAARGRT